MRWTSYGELRLYSTYILSNVSMTLYIDVTNNLARRVSQHKKGHGSGFTSRYHFDRLVYFEQTPDIRDAIAREKVLTITLLSFPPLPAGMESEAED